MTSTSGSPGEERAREDRYADVGGHGHTALASGYGECVPESVPYPTRGVGAGAVGTGMWQARGVGYVRAGVER